MVKGGVGRERKCHVSMQKKGIIAWKMRIGTQMWVWTKREGGRKGERGEKSVNE